MIFGPGVKTHYILARECQRLLRIVHESSISQCSKRPEVETYKKHGPGLLQRTECLQAVNATKMELKISKQKFAESNQTRGMGQSLFFVIFCMVLQTVFYVFRPLTLKGQMFQAEHATRWKYLDSAKLRAGHDKQSQRKNKHRQSLTANKGTRSVFAFVPDLKRKRLNFAIAHAKQLMGFAVCNRMQNKPSENLKQTYIIIESYRIYIFMYLSSGAYVKIWSSHQRPDKVEVLCAATWHWANTRKELVRSTVASMSGLSALPQNVHEGVEGATNLAKQIKTACFDMFWYVLIWFDMFWYVLICFDMFWYVLICFDMFWYVLIYFDMCWYVLIYCDMFWYVLICFDMFWYVLICFDIFWYVLVCFDILWYVLICFDMFWYVLICFDMFWYVLIYFDMCWYVLIYCDMFWYVLICFDMCWYVLICFDMFWYILICVGMFWYIVICFDMFWYVLICFDMFWYVLICFDMFWYVLIYCDMCWYVLIYCDMFWYVLICFDMCWYVLIYFDMCWYVLIYCDMFWYLVICFDMFWYVLICFDMFCACFLLLMAQSPS